MLTLDVSGLRAGYGRTEVLHGVDLRVPAGKAVALLGANGAGKSTLLKAIAGLVPARTGSVRLLGEPVERRPANFRARKGVCLIPEGRGIFPNLTVRENLWMMSHARRALTEIEETAYERFPRLRQRHTQMAGTLSGGEQQMLALARGLATDPAVLMLDELSMGLAPIIVEELYQLVASVAKEGMSILVVEQFARIVMDVADWAAVMVQGRVTLTGRPRDLEETLSSAYLGG